MQYNNGMALANKIVITGIMASTFSGYAQSGIEIEEPQLNHRYEIISHFNPSFAKQHKYRPISIVENDSYFENSISEFYDKISQSQEVLGSDIVNLIANNLWDLY